MDWIETIVIGAGVVGLAVAAELACLGQEVLILEKNHHFGEETSSRNSGVIHAGIYYPTASLKAKLCVAGKHLLYDFCKTHQVNHYNIGKIIVAKDESETAKLKQIHQRAIANGVTDLKFLSQSDLKIIEPEVSGYQALHSPSTGIIDVHGYMLSLLGILESNQGSIAYGARSLKIIQNAKGFEVECQIEENGNSAQTYKLCAKNIINCAGLHAVTVAHQMDFYPKSLIPENCFTKGNYIKIEGRSPFQHLIYPIPPEGGLGVHFTLDLAGNGRFGPNVEWPDSSQAAKMKADELNYNPTDSIIHDFYAPIATYWEGIYQHKLLADYAGFRPKVVFPNQSHKPVEDFVIQTFTDHQIQGLVQLFGIESPGLTASLALAKLVASNLANHGNSL